MLIETVGVRSQRSFLTPARAYYHCLSLSDILPPVPSAWGLTIASYPAFGSFYSHLEMRSMLCAEKQSVFASEIKITECVLSLNACKAEANGPE